MKPLAFIELCDPTALIALAEKLGAFDLVLDQYVVADGMIFETLERGKPFRSILCAK